MRRFSRQQAIMGTLIYFDLFEYPLTLVEVWQTLFLTSPCSISDVAEMLETSELLQSLTCSRDGLFFLAGREQNLERRHERFLIAERKMRQAVWAARLFAHMPFVRMVCVCNSLSLWNTSEKSDIDFCIVANKGTLWLTRLFCAGLMAVCKKRPGQTRSHDALCVSFFITHDALDVSSLALRERDGLPDLHFAIRMAHYLPLYTSEKCVQSLFDANKWLGDIFPNRFPVLPHPRHVITLGVVSRAVKGFFETLLCVWGSFFERSARVFQEKLLPKKIRERIGIDSGVVLSDTVLRFHTDNTCETVRKQFLHRLKEYYIDV